MVKSIIIPDELHGELVREIGATQSAEGKNITMAKMIERLLIYWRTKKR